MLAAVGSPFIHLAELLTKTDNAILEARLMIQSPIRDSPSHPAPSLPDVPVTPAPAPSRITNEIEILATFDSYLL